MNSIFKEQSNAIGWRDMHPLQIEEFTNFISGMIELSALIDDEDVFLRVKAQAHELIRVFGTEGCPYKKTLRRGGLFSVRN